MALTLVGLFDSKSDAQAALDELAQAGVDRAGIKLISSKDAQGQSLGRSLAALGVPAGDAELFTEGVRRNGTLVTARVDDAMAERAQALLENRGAFDLQSRSAQWAQSGWTPATAGGQNEMTLPVVQEELQVGKREVQRGGVRVYKTVEERPIEETVQLREEHVTVDRRPVDRPASENELARFGEGTIEVTEMAEEAVVAKRTRVIEEVIISKDVQERTETVRDTVRRTDVNVEQLGGASTAGRGGQVAGTTGFDAFDADFRSNYQSSFGSRGYSYDQYAPAYRYGYNLASDPRYGSSDWQTVESAARDNWEQHNKGTWDEFKDAVRYAWDSVRGKTRGTAR